MQYKVVTICITLTVIILQTGAAENSNVCTDCTTPVYICPNGILVFNDIFIIDSKHGVTYENPNGFEDYRKKSNCAALNVAQYLFDRLSNSFKISTRSVFSKGENCGLRNENGLIFRITGANKGESQYAEFPWMAAIMKFENANGGDFKIYQCGGSLIHLKVVLTAAHCIWKKNADKLLVRLGEWDTQRTTEPLSHQDFYVEDMIIHPEFNPKNLYNDVGLIFLNHEFKPAGNVAPICLPQPDVQYNKKDCIVTGWGKDNFGKTGRYQEILKKVQLPIVAQGSCQTSLRKTQLGRHFKLHQSFLCAGGIEGEDTCRGDGGSPLACRVLNEKHYVQVGIVAWGIGCGTSSLPGVYTNVPLFIQWINEKIINKV